MNRSVGHSNRVNREALLGGFVCTGSNSFPMNPENKGPKGPHIVHLSTMSHFLTIDQGGHLVSSIGPKNINLVEDIENASFQVSLNSVQRFQNSSQKCLSQSEAGTAILFLRSVRKTQTWLRALRSCFQSSFIEFCSMVSEEK